MDASSYFEQIERYFVAKRGSALILSPKDWPVVASWEERGVPVEVIFEGIDRAFARFQDKHAAGQHQTVCTLSSCQYDVEDVWKSWREEHPEARKPAEEHSCDAERRKVSMKLQHTITRLQSCCADAHYVCIHDALAAAAEQLRALATQIEAAADDEELAALAASIHDVEIALTTHLDYAISDELRRALQAKAEARLASHKHQMNDAIYQETLRLAFLQELHNAYPLPSFA